MKIYLILLLLIAMAMIPSASAVCTTVCYVDDDGTGDYNVDHVDDAVQINQAIIQVGSYASASTPGTVILNYTSAAYELDTWINMNQNYVTLRGENKSVTTHAFNGVNNNQNTQGILMNANYIGLNNLTLVGNTALNGWTGGGDLRREIRISDSTKHDMVIQDIIGTDTVEDVIWGTGYNITIKNIYVYDIYHSGIYTQFGSSNWTIDNVYCRNAHNACVRLDVMNTATVKNIYNENTNGYTQYTIEIWVTSLGWSAKNIYFENITSLNVLINPIVMHSEITSQWNIQNMTFKNVLINCSSYAYDTSCGTYSGDDAGAVIIRNAQDIAFDGVTVVNTANPVFSIINEGSVANNIVIKNSIIANNNHYAIVKTGTGATNWNVNYNDFWNNALGNTSGSVTLGSGMLFQNPLFASSTDFHLKSQYGRWTGTAWTNDAATSPAIDAGDPLTSYVLEPSPNGGRINLGAYGNTPKASKSGSGLQQSFDFLVSNSGNISVPVGGSDSNIIMADIISGNSEPVTFSITGLPSSSSASISGGNTCSPTCSKTLTIYTTNSTSTGTYPITITATNGTLTRTTNFDLIVILSSPYNVITLKVINDTSIKSGAPDLIRSSYEWIDLGMLAGSTYGSYRGLLSFDLSSIPSSATINSANLTLIPETGGNRNQTTIINVFRPSSVWDLNATWNNRQTALSWTTSGGDWIDQNGDSYGALPYAQMTYTLGSTANANFDVKSLVQSYIGGAYPNTGFFLKANEVENTYISFYSSEAIDVNNRPRLVINYSTGNVNFEPEDVNMDGIINQTDLNIVGDSIKTNTVCPRCDIDRNGVVDIYDIMKVSVKLS
jgi:hypothetical protein